MSTATLEQLDFDSTLEDATGGNIKVFKSDYRGRGRFPVIDQGQDFVAGFVDSEDAVCQVELPVIVFGDHTCAFKFVDFPFVLGADGVKVLKPKPGFDAKFLYYWLCQLKLPDTGYDRHFKYLKRAKFPPRRSLAEQKRIAAILDKADAIRRRRQEAARLADTLILSVFYEMFGDPVKFKPMSLEQLRDEFRYGTSVKSEPNGVPTLRIPNIIGGKVDWTAMKSVPLDVAEFDRLRLVDGDVLFVRTNGNPDYVGRCAVFDREDARAHGFDPNGVVYASYLIRGRLDHGRLNPHYLQRYLETMRGRHEVRENCRTSAGQYNINTEGLGSLQIPLPPIDLQNQFAASVERVRVHLTERNGTTAGYDDLFNGLVQRAFRGEL